MAEKRRQKKSAAEKRQQNKSAAEVAEQEAKLGETVATFFTFSGKQCSPAMEQYLGMSADQLMKMSTQSNFSGLKCGLYQPDDCLNRAIAKIKSIWDVNYCLTGIQLMDQFYKRISNRVVNPSAENHCQFSASVRAMMRKDYKRYYWLTFYVMEPLELVDKLFHQLPPRQAFYYPELATAKRAKLPLKDIICIPYWGIVVHIGSTVPGDNEAEWYGTNELPSDYLYEPNIHKMGYASSRRKTHRCNDGDGGDIGNKTHADDDQVATRAGSSHSNRKVYDDDDNAFATTPVSLAHVCWC